MTNNNNNNNKETTMTETEREQKTALDNLRNQLDSNALQTNADLKTYLLNSGRLASLGDNTGVLKLPDVLKQPQYQGRLDTAVNELTNTISQNCNNQQGNGLGQAIIKAQDLYCFYRYCDDLLSLSTINAILELAETVNRVELDDDAVETLELFLLVYPLQEDDQLAPVAAPMTERQKQIVNMLLVSPKVYHYTSETIDGVWTCKPKHAGEEVVFKKIWDGKNLVVTVSDNCPTIALMRVGAMPMEQTEKGRWTNLIPMPAKRQDVIDYLTNKAELMVKTRHARLIIK